MSPNKLRLALVVSALFGVGIVVNILNGQMSSDDDGTRLADAKPAMVRRGGGTARNDARKTLEAVRRELVNRQYLSDVAGGVAGAPQTTTRAAILAFEFDFHLALTATASETLLKDLIFTHAPLPSQRLTVPETDAAQDLIIAVQRALVHLGYANEKPTGELDQATREAIAKFERTRGLEVSGRISAPLINSLGPAFEEAVAGRLSGERGTTGAG